MPKSRKNTSVGKAIGFILLGLSVLTLIIASLLRGHNIALFNPKGMIAQEQHSLMVVTVGIMLIIAIPALFLLYFFAWKYRESNTKAAHDPQQRYGRGLDVTMWLVPGIFAVVLASIMWPATHRLEPQKLISADADTLKIKVVSLRWKWLFIYPDQNIATVNFVQIPVNRPVQFELTADDAPMSSFWVPNLGGMLYSMTSHTNRLNLIADTLGDYPGSTAEINGAGFAGMKFTTRVSSSDDFNGWVEAVKQSPTTLNMGEYSKLLAPSENNPAAFYYSPEGSGLYDTVLMKYTAGHNHAHAAAEHGGHQ